MVCEICNFILKRGIVTYLAGSNSQSAGNRKTLIHRPSRKYSYTQAPLNSSDERHNPRGIPPFAFGHYSAAGHPGLPNEHGHGSARGQQCYVEMRGDGLADAQHYVAARGQRADSPRQRSRR